MEKQYLIVELVQPEKVAALREQVADLEAQLEAKERQYRDLEMRFGFECYLNNELCDLCRESGISFRPALEHARREQEKR